VRFEENCAHSLPGHDAGPQEQSERARQSALLGRRRGNHQAPLFWGKVTSMSVLTGKTVVLGVTGGISAYKAAELCRLLRKADAAVRVVMTQAAGAFITPLTLQTLSGHPVAKDLLDPGEEASIGHIRLADEADVVVVAPATADAIARMAAGMADDLLAAVVLATRAPVLLAPAMNVNMWENPLTQENLRRLIATGRFTTVGPDRGDLACGWVGAGRLVEPAEILAAIEALIARGARPGALAGRRVVITAGPTYEPIDDVRFLGNRSSGKMGFALARAAAALDAEVTLVAGPVALGTPPGVARRVDVESVGEMEQALHAHAEDADVVVMAAAVSDFRPAERIAGKLSLRRSSPGAGRAELLTLSLVPNPDLLADLGTRRRGGRPFIVGFAAETGLKVRGDLVAGDMDPSQDSNLEALVTRARAKMAEKGCDAMVANDVGEPGLGFGSDHNAVTVILPAGAPVSIGPRPKAELAEAIWASIAPWLPPVPAPAEPVPLRPLGEAPSQTDPPEATSIFHAKR
jgi:phosphopantothenoylcysteine decarboxylase / phosphopantothenate---cysteine ligase